MKTDIINIRELDGLIIAEGKPDERFLSMPFDNKNIAGVHYTILGKACEIARNLSHVSGKMTIIKDHYGGQEYYINYCLLLND